MSTAGNSSGEGATKDAVGELRSKLSDVAGNVKELGSLARSTVQETVQQKVGDLQQSATQYYEMGRQRMGQAEQSMEEYIRQQPVKAVMIAAGVGILLGCCLRR